MKKLLAALLTLLLLALSVCALADGMPQDGTYAVPVTLSGGTGRASVASPAEVTVADGQVTAVILWSSPYYDYMLVNGVKYMPVNTEGNSAFEIPVLLDTDMAVVADTTAMSVPHEVEYTLRFDSAGLRPLGGGAPLVPVAAGAGVLVLIIVLAGAFFHQKYRKKSRV